MLNFNYFRSRCVVINAGWLGSEFRLLAVSLVSRSVVGWVGLPVFMLNIGGGCDLFSRLPSARGICSCRILWRLGV